MVAALLENGVKKSHHGQYECMYIRDLFSDKSNFAGVVVGVHVSSRDLFSYKSPLHGVVLGLTAWIIFVYGGFLFFHAPLHFSSSIYLVTLHRDFSDGILKSLRQDGNI